MSRAQAKRANNLRRSRIALRMATKLLWNTHTHTGRTHTHTVTGAAGMQTIKPFTFFCCCLFLSASGLLAHDLALNPNPDQPGWRQDRLFDELSTDKSCVCPAVCEMDLPLGGGGGRAYLLGRKVLHNIYAGKWPIIYNDTRHFVTSFWPPEVANKMNFLNAQQSRKLQFPIAKQSNLIKRIPNAILVCVCVCACVYCCMCNKSGQQSVLSRVKSI